MCSSCKITLKDWKEGDSIPERHAASNPHCPFLIGSEAENLRREEESNLRETATSEVDEPLAPDSRPREEENCLQGTAPLEASRRERELNTRERELNTRERELKAQEMRAESAGVMPENMNDEERRFATFPVSLEINVDTRELAKAGFYYIGPGDRVRCAFCKVNLHNWKEGDDVYEEHDKYAPACPFMAILEIEKMGVFYQKPRNRHMAVESNRIKTFAGWKTSQTPEDLARAGFIYMGNGDRVKCFFCAGQLYNWEAGDKPWEEHARHFPQCSYLLQSKGKAFVERVQTSFSSATGPIRHLTEEKGEELPLIPSSSERDVKALEAKIKDLKDRKLCKICFDSPFNIVFLPCGHLVCCSTCAPALENCCICRSLIRGTVRVYNNFS